LESLPEPEKWARSGGKKGGERKRGGGRVGVSEPEGDTRSKWTSFLVEPNAGLVFREKLQKKMKAKKIKGDEPVEVDRRGGVRSLKSSRQRGQ